MGHIFKSLIIKIYLLFTSYSNTLGLCGLGEKNINFNISLNINIDGITILIHLQLPLTTKGGKRRGRNEFRNYKLM